MEANEAQELQEHAEHGAHEPSLRPVAFTMSVLAVLVAIITVLGHRTHTEAVLDQNEATDQWNYYQAHKIRVERHGSGGRPPERRHHRRQGRRQQTRQGLHRHQEKWAENLKEEQEKAEALESKVKQAEARADRFDLGEALLEIGLVITSVTLLTRKRAYWFFGLAFSLGGIASALSVLLLK